MRQETEQTFGVGCAKTRMMTLRCFSARRTRPLCAPVTPFSSSRMMPRCDYSYIRRRFFRRWKASSNNVSQVRRAHYYYLLSIDRSRIRRDTYWDQRDLCSSACPVSDHETHHFMFEPHTLLLIVAAIGCDNTAGWNNIQCPILWPISFATNDHRIML